MVSFAIDRGGVARTFDLTPTPTCAGHGDSIPLMWPPGRPGALSRLSRTLASCLLDLDGPWPMAGLLACLMSVQSVRGVAVAVSRRAASMARRFRPHDGGTRRRLGNPCKQMQSRTNPADESFLWLARHTLSSSSMRRGYDPKLPR